MMTDRGDSEDRDDGDGCIMIVSFQLLGCTWVHVLSVVIVFLCSYGPAACTDK